MESDDNDQVYIPQVKSVLVPKLQQEFGTIDEVADFCNRYAKEAGFSIRSHTSVMSKDNTTLRGMSISVISKEIPRFREKSLSLVNVKTHKWFEFFGIQAGGIENIGCTQRDLYNYGRTYHEEKKGHDGDILYMHFQNEKEKDSFFVYKMESDEENKVTRCFWADSISRRAYSFYGDVVIFDTTYNTNRYGMIFAPFTGVNNHGQTIIFACAFLNDETADSFVCADEFDSRWIEIIEKHGLSDNKWLELIYEIRSSWIPAHFKRGLLHQRHYELEEGHINIEEKPKTVMSLELEDHMAKVYTRNLVAKDGDSSSTSTDEGSDVPVTGHKTTTLFDNRSIRQIRFDQSKD
uniref:uncharacterized protein LOC105352638 n=1 Tax=Fragaria vesca subsp. vesca TaxID=101020 RepID=UPI0005C94FE2|nr:PREDICTED: uncharacterized protein LOC105352638 [Fragaria vesca subsp. vesca]